MVIIIELDKPIKPIGILITVFFTSTPWLIPKIDILMGIGSYSNNTFYFSWPDHFALTLFPMFSHIGLNLITKLGNGLLPTCTCGGNNEIEWVQ